MSRLTLAMAPLLPIMGPGGQASTARDGFVVPPGAEGIARTTSKGGAVHTYDVGQGSDEHDKVRADRAPQPGS